jgi:hypothetical protein
MNLAWHFVATKDGKPVLRDGRPLPAAWQEHRDKMNTVLESMLLNAMDVSL